MLFDNWLLVENGRFREAETRRLLTEAPYPSRNPDTNLADLRAQIAANQKGVDEVGKMIDHFGLDVVQAYMRHVQDNAEEAVRRVIDAARRRRLPLRDRLRRDRSPSGSPSTATDAAPPSTSPAPRPSSAPTSTRRPRWRPPPCCTSSAPWSPTTSRSTTAACARCSIVIPRRLDARPEPTRPRSSPATSRPRRRSPARCYAALRRAGRGLRDDEQRHLRQRAAPVLRDRRPRAPAPATASTGRPWCRRT